MYLYSVITIGILHNVKTYVMYVMKCLSLHLGYHETMVTDSVTGCLKLKNKFSRKRVTNTDNICLWMLVTEHFRFELVDHYRLPLGWVKI